jgi:hypothetical protein
MAKSRVRHGQLPITQYLLVVTDIKICNIPRQHFICPLQVMFKGLGLPMPLDLEQVNGQALPKVFSCSPNVKTVAINGWEPGL